MNPRRFAFVLVALGVVAVAAYVGSAGRTRLAATKAQTAAFEHSHPGAKLVTLDVDGMSCPDCAKSVGEELEKVDGVVACRVDLARQVAEVRLASTDVPNEALVAAVHDAGYVARVDTR
jgi:copper chaperone CopZ